MRLREYLVLIGGVLLRDLPARFARKGRKEGKINKENE